MPLLKHQQLGLVVIRTGTRCISDNEGFFDQKIMDLFKEENWRLFWLNPDEIFAGPFCYTQEEMEIPF